MNWCCISIQRLKDYERRQQSLSAIEGHIKALEYQYTAIRSATNDATPVQESTNRREQMLIENIAARQELENNKRIAEREIELTEKGLAGLTEEERRILELFFISRPSDHIERLCDELFIGKSELYRRKDDALKNFTMATYGVVEI